MHVYRDLLSYALGVIRQERFLSLDTETTGLQPYHGDQLFGISVATAKESFYFSEFFLELREALLGDKYFFFMNAKFDLAMLANKGLTIEGTIHDIKVAERCLQNNLVSYSLAAIAKRYGYEKDDAVDKYIKEHKLWTVQEVPGKNREEKRLHFDKVPLEIMSKYAEQDARITYDIGIKQLAKFKRIREEKIRESNRSSGTQKKKIKGVWIPFKQERTLTRVLFDCERHGISVDRVYCESAIRYEAERIERAKDALFSLAGSKNITSTKLFRDIFRDETWVFLPETATGKINPTFDSSVLENFKHPAAKVILDYRDAKARSDYFHGFLYHADDRGILHPNFDQSGTATGRFSSSSPNLQNLSKEKDYQGDFPVRRALVPRPGHYFLIFDMDQAEYRLLLDHCNAKKLIKKIIDEGLDVHEATAKLAGITRDQAKTTNFAVLYGAGYSTLAKSLGVSLRRAQEIKRDIFLAAPEMASWIESVKRLAETRKWVENYLGRRSYFPDPRHSYLAVNYIIQGGVADIVKNAMTLFYEKRHEFKGVSLILNVHDELVFEVDSLVLGVEDRLKSLLEGGYSHRFLPLTWGVSHSFRSLYDKTKGGLKAADKKPEASMDGISLSSSTLQLEA